MSPMLKGEADRRTTPRDNGPYSAVIKLYSGRLLPCTVLNMSENGAKIALARDKMLPKQFELTIPARNAAWRVRVVWQQGRELGIFRV
jgi:hypothetical protein